MITLFSLFDAAHRSAVPHTEACTGPGQRMLFPCKARFTRAGSRFTWRMFRGVGFPRVLLALLLSAASMTSLAQGFGSISGSSAIPPAPSYRR